MDKVEENMPDGVVNLYYYGLTKDLLKVKFTFPVDEFMVPTLLDKFNEAVHCKMLFKISGMFIDTEKFIVQYLGQANYIDADEARSIL